MAQLSEQGLRLLEIDVLAQSLGAIEVESRAGTHLGLGNVARSELSQLRPSRSATKGRRAPYLEGVACVDWGTSSPRRSLWSGLHHVVIFFAARTCSF